MTRIRFFPPSSAPSLAEIGNWCGATLAANADPDRLIRDVAALDQAGPGDLTFLDNPRYLGWLKQTRAAAALISPRYADVAPATCAVLIAVEPYRAMALVMTRLYPSAVKPASVFGEAGISTMARIHPSAIKAMIGSHHRVWYYSSNRSLVPVDFEGAIEASGPCALRPWSRNRLTIG